MSKPLPQYSFHLGLSSNEHSPHGHFYTLDRTNRKVLMYTNNRPTGIARLWRSRLGQCLAETTLI
jgi:hypothetical protein